ncbi:uncharacterized protein LOC131432537 [Malaya genurostris]|uniref:uncharacterized protein LOC131432537 n=1 Tax=Malaya genurostris TaxID=325434 RepID=UPI0026F3A2BF|nr:uncharacterized protein LOC131432537 [Malaya genurostris]
MSDSEEQQLDQFFREDARTILSMSFLFPKSVRDMIRMWFTTFYKMGGNFLDKQMRNQYAAHMLMQLEVKRGLSKPFDEPAPDHINIPLVKVLSTDDYINFFEKCEKYYRLKKRPDIESQPGCLQMHPAEFLYSSPPITTGVVAYGACFSKDTQ